MRFHLVPNILRLVIKIVRKKKGGGVAIYITNCINFEIFDKLTCGVNNVLENISVELHIVNSTPIIVSCLYRPSYSKISLSIDIIENLLTNVKCHPYLCGNFNVNLLNYHLQNDTIYILNAQFVLSVATIRLK